MTLLFPTWGHLIAYMAHSGKHGSVSRKHGSVSRKQGQWVFKEAV